MARSMLDRARCSFDTVARDPRAGYCLELVVVNAPASQQLPWPELLP